MRTMHVKYVNPEDVHFMRFNPMRFTIAQNNDGAFYIRIMPHNALDDVPQMRQTFPYQFRYIVKHNAKGDMIITCKVSQNLVKHYGTKISDMVKAQLGELAGKAFFG